LKITVEAKLALYDQINKLTTDLSTSKSEASNLKRPCVELEKKEEESTAEVSRYNVIIHDQEGTISAKDETIARFEKEVAALKDFMLKVAEDGWVSSSCPIIRGSF